MSILSLEGLIKILHNFKAKSNSLIQSGFDKLNSVKGVDILIAFEDDNLQEKIHSIEL